MSKQLTPDYREVTDTSWTFPSPFAVNPQNPGNSTMEVLAGALDVVVFGGDPFPDWKAGGQGRIRDQLVAIRPGDYIWFVSTSSSPQIRRVVSVNHKTQTAKVNLAFDTVHPSSPAVFTRLGSNDENLGRVEVKNKTGSANSVYIGYLSGRVQELTVGQSASLDLVLGGLLAPIVVTSSAGGGTTAIISNVRNAG